MPDEFRTDLEWPTDPFGGAREPAVERKASAAEPSPAAPDLEALERVVERALAAVGDSFHDLQVRLHADYDALRSEVAALRASVDALVAGHAEPAEVAGDAPVSLAPVSLAPVLEEIDRVRDEITSLKRRITLRAEAAADAAVLTDEQLDRIARTVAGLLSRGTERAR
jgi:hypothetical protein